MAIGYFKSFKPEDVSHQPFVANKVWTTTQGPLSTAIELTGSLITGSNHFIASFSSASKNSFISASSTEPVSNTRYKFILHSNIDQMFYRYNSKGMENDSHASPCQLNDPGRQHRELHSQAHIISIPQSLWGEGIKPNTVNIMDSNLSPNIRLKDDGYANLVDVSVATSSLVGKQNLTIHIPFSDGFRYDNPKDRLITQGRYYGDKRGLDYKGPFPYNVCSNDVRYKKGMNGSALNTQGVSGSYVLAKRLGDELTRLGTGQEFAISMWLKIPTSQSVSQSREGAFESYKTITKDSNTSYIVKRRKLKDHTENVIISKNIAGGNINSPFEVCIGNSWGSNNGKIIFRRSNGILSKTMISSTSYNDNVWRHFLFQKTGSNLEMYCNGSRISTTTDFADQQYSTISGAPIQIGARRDRLPFKISISGRGVPTPPQPTPDNFNSSYEPMSYEDSLKYKRNVESMIRPFTGSMDEIRLYSKAIHSSSIIALSSSVTNTNIVGNIFYDYGLAVVTDPRTPYTNMFEDNTKWYVNFQNKHTIYESEYYCHIKNDEYELSMNPTLRIDNSIKDERLKGMASSSHFAPYITTIGLYNDNLDLLAVAKTATPIKKPKNMDTTIVIRFDK